MSLGNQKDPVVTIWEEEGESQRISRVKDHEVVRDLDSRTTWHISCDNISYMDGSHTTWAVCGQDKNPGWHTAKDDEEKMVIQEDQDGDLGLRQSELIYVMRPTLKQSLNMKPTTTILGTLLQES